MKNTTVLLLAAALAVSAQIATAASITFNLTQDACTGSCGTNPFGTITLTESGTGTNAIVTVVETLKSGERFAGTGAGDALEFNVAGTIAITGLTSGFGIGPAPDTASAFGSFLKSIACTSCQGGQAGNPAGPLTFNVGSTTGVTIASFTANTGGFFFASDIVGTNGNTGNVGAGAATVTPEPTTIMTALAGLALLGIAKVGKSRWV